MRVLSWNLFHGRARPPAGRDLREAFASALASWPWDVALLQEVPPWWPPGLADRCGAEQRTALTSRNLGLDARRWAAERAPDLVKSGGGGANVILARGPIADHRWRRLRSWPERRVVQAVQLEGVWVANLHASAHRPDRARADLQRARALALKWAGGAPLVLGGDLNLRLVSLEGFAHAAGHSVDHLLVRGLRTTGPPGLLERGGLSDHAPLTVELATDAASAP